MDEVITFTAGVSSSSDATKAQGTVCALENMFPAPDGRLYRRAAATEVGYRSASPNPARPVRTLDFTDNGVEYVLLYSYGDTLVPASGSIPASAAGVYCVNKATGQFLTVTGTVPFAVATSGLSAATGFGSYVLLASAGCPFSTQAHGLPPQNTVVWIKSGGYNKTYSIKIGSLTASYTTLKAEHDEVLDTSGIPLFTSDGTGTVSESEPPYAKPDGTGRAQHTLTWGQWYDSPLPPIVYVGSITSAWTNTYPAMPTAAGQFYWNSAAPSTIIFHSASVNGINGLVISYSHHKVVQHPAYARRVQEAQEAYDNRVAAHAEQAVYSVRPTTIAANLGSQLTALGLDVHVYGSFITIPTTAHVTVSDGEHDTLIVAHGANNQVSAAEDLPPKHYVGGFVRVGTGVASYGMIADAPAGSSLTAGQFGSVIWREYNKDAAYVEWTGGLLFAKVHDGQLVVAESADAMAALTGSAHPALVRPNVVINHAVVSLLSGEFPRTLDTLYGRLVIGCRRFVAVSAAGDPLNFDSLSRLTVAASDAFALQASGMDDATLWGSAPFYGGLVLFGNGQFLLSGRGSISATSTTLMRLSSTPVDKETTPCAVGERFVAVRRVNGIPQFLSISPGPVENSAVEGLMLPQFREAMGRIDRLLWQPAGQVLVAQTQNELWVFQAHGDGVLAPWRIKYTGGMTQPVVCAVTVSGADLLVFVRYSVNFSSKFAVWRQPLTAGSGADPSGTAAALVTFPKPYERDFTGRRKTTGVTLLNNVTVDLEESGHADIAFASGYVERLSPDTIDVVGSRTHLVPVMEESDRFTVSAVTDAPLVITGVVARVQNVKRG